MTQWGLDTLFNPAKRHMDEEKRRLQSTREEVGDSSGGKRIDLESGKVSISKAKSADDESADETLEATSEVPADETVQATSGAVKPAATPATPAEESPARARARARRARR